MPSRDEHISKAKLNKTFADSLKLDNSTAVGWALTALFYSALHYIEAYNAKHHFHCKNHQELHDNIKRNPVLEAILEDYLDLSNFSWNARYMWVNYGREKFEEALDYHAAVKNHIADLIANER